MTEPAASQRTNTQGLRVATVDRTNRARYPKHDRCRKNAADGPNAMGSREQRGATADAPSAMRRRGRNDGVIWRLCEQGKVVINDNQHVRVRRDYSRQCFRTALGQA